MTGEQGASGPMCEDRPIATEAEIGGPGFDLRGERTELRVLLADTWRARGLIGVLARKDFFVRFRRASFGVGWAVVLPFVQAAVMSIVLPRIVTFDVPGNFLTFSLAGLTAWAFFSASLGTGVGAIVEGQDLSTKVYFPRIVLPIVSVLANVYGLLPGVAVLAVVAALSGTAGLSLVALVPAVAMLATLTTAFVVVLAALQVYFRDVRYILQAGLLAWFYATPVLYPLQAVGGLRGWFALNPMTGVVDVFRFAALGSPGVSWSAVASTIVWSAGLVGVGLALHRRFDRVFVDLL